MPITPSASFNTYATGFPSSSFLERWGMVHALLEMRHGLRAGNLKPLSIKGVDEPVAQLWAVQISASLLNHHEEDTYCHRQSCWHCGTEYHGRCPGKHGHRSSPPPADP